jgi:hypothetical protein
MLSLSILPPSKTTLYQKSPWTIKTPGQLNIKNRAREEQTNGLEPEAIFTFTLMLLIPFAGFYAACRPGLGRL